MEKKDFWETDNWTRKTVSSVSVYNIILKISMSLQTKVIIITLHKHT